MTQIGVHSNSGQQDGDKKAEVCKQWGLMQNLAACKDQVSSILC